MKRRNLVAVTSLLVFFVLFVYNTPVFSMKFKASSFIEDVFGNRELESRMAELEKENAFLRTQILDQEKLTKDTIKVYSTYPFNNTGEIVIAGGEDRGIEIGDVVVYAGDVFVGVVKNVMEHTSVVTTIFNPSWEISVRVGDREIDALLSGGNTPELSLVPQGELIEEGELVLTASQDFPYGLEIGSIERINEESDQVFREAIVKPSFQLRLLRNVAIYR